MPAPLLQDFILTFTPKPDVCQPTGSAELPMLDIYMPMMKSAAIVAAARLGLFEALSAGALDTPELARRLAAEGGTAIGWGVKRWNAPSIGFYRSLGAEGDPGLSERMSLGGAALARLAGAP